MEASHGDYAENINTGTAIGFPSRRVQDSLRIITQEAPVIKRKDICIRQILKREHVNSRTTIQALLQEPES